MGTCKMISHLYKIYWPAIKKSWFAVLLPTRQTWPYPILFCHSEEKSFCVRNPCKIPMTDTTLSLYKSVVLITGNVAQTFIYNILSLYKEFVR